MDKAPDAFRTISEVAEELEVPQHVLRFWETRFTQIKPMKRSGGRRYYRPDDVDLLRGIRRLLYGEGYTIRGVQRILKEHGIKSVQALTESGPAAFGPIERAMPRRGADERDDDPREETDFVSRERDYDVGTGDDIDSDVADDAAGDAHDEDVDEDEAAEEHTSPRREPVLSPQRIEPVLRAGPAQPSYRAAGGAPVERSAGARAAINRDRLHAVLADLTACRELLDSVLKES